MDFGSDDSLLQGRSTERAVDLRHAALLINPRAREGALAEQAGHALAARGIGLLDQRVLTSLDEIPSAVQNALDRGARLIVVGGGDGTLSAVANLLAETGVALGILPLGTGNDFARSLGLPLTWEEACDAIASGRARAVDLGKVDERYFLNATSFGLTSGVTRRMRPALKRWAGALAYPAAAVAESLAHGSFRLSVKHARGHEELHALQVVIGNSPYHGGGKLIAPDASLENRTLDLYVIEAATAGAGRFDKAQNLLRLARIGALLRQGKHLTHPAVLHLRAAVFKLEADPPQELDIDGELLGHTPTLVSVAPGALEVVVPS